MSITRADYIAWLAKLRDPNTIQQFHFNGRGTCVCAVGASPRSNGRVMPAAAYDISTEAYVTIVRWNDDDRLPLPAIADKIEALVAAGEIVVSP